MQLPTFRLTIVGLMGVVLAFGIAIAALRDASNLWGGVMLLVTASVLGAAILGSKHGRGPNRAGWHGFALFGWGYLIATMAPWFAEQIGPNLPTTLALDHLQSLAVGPPAKVSLIGNVTVSGPGSSVKADRMEIVYQDARTTTTGPSGQDGAYALSQLARTALPGAINREAFFRVGHCLFALMAAVLGAIIGRRFHSAAEVPGDDLTRRIDSPSS